jgi:hypothetical protein
MLCHNARRDARFSGGELVLLEDQDRALWDAAQVAQAGDLLERAIALRGRGRTCCRRRSPRYRPSTTSIGSRSPRSTASLLGSHAHRWLSSTAPSRSQRPARRRQLWTSSSDFRSRTTSSCTRRGPSCCAASAAPTTPGPPTSEHSSSPAPSPSDGSSSAGSANSDPQPPANACCSRRPPSVQNVLDRT